MKKKLIITVLAGLFIVSVWGQNPPQDRNWNTVFVDSFNAPTLNTSRWNKSYGSHNAGNLEGDGVEFRTYENVYIENGKLVLRTQEENRVCTHPNTCRYKDSNSIHKYTSGSITSCTTYRYGYYEVYAKLPTGCGYSPTFWLWNCGLNPTNNTCWYNEINVFEVNGCNSNSFGTGLHVNLDTCPPSNGPAIGGNIDCNYADAYHWYAIEWDRDKITWYLNNKEVWQKKNYVEGAGAGGAQQAQYLLLSVGLYERETDEHYITTSTVFPQNMYIDQFNHYKLKYDCYTVVNEIPNYNTFNYGVKKSISLSGVSSLSQGENVSLRATDFIELKDGFEVPEDAELYLDINPCEDEKMVVFPNYPSPFCETTTITCYIAEGMQKVQLQMYNRYGELVKNTDITERGTVNAVFHADEFSVAGAYTYYLTGYNGDEVETSNIMEMVVMGEEISISQNYPNPFAEATSIECFIPQVVQNAKLHVRNMAGDLVKEMDIADRCAVSIPFHAEGLEAGIYTYLLIGDGKASDEKQMIIVKE